MSDLLASKPFLDFFVYQKTVLLVDFVQLLPQRTAQALFSERKNFPDTSCLVTFSLLALFFSLRTLKYPVLTLTHTHTYSHTHTHSLTLLVLHCEQKISCSKKKTKHICFSLFHAPTKCRTICISCKQEDGLLGWEQGHWQRAMTGSRSRGGKVKIGELMMGTDVMPEETSEWRHHRSDTVRRSMMM